MQAAEVDVLQQELLVKDQVAEHLQLKVEAERLERLRAVDELEAQVTQLRGALEQPLAELGALRTQMRNKQDSWDKQKYDLETQMDRLMGVLRKMGLLADSEGQRMASAPSPPSTLDFTSAGSGLTAPEAQALQVRELSMLLAEARHQAESYRRQLAMRSIPGEEMALDMKRLKADNQRLVALLAAVPEYRAMAAEVAADSGVHYIPLEECLMIRGLVDQLHPQLLDRPVEQVAGSELAGAGRRRDPDGGDPSLTLVLDEQYHWVPRRALETGAALMRRLMPALPMSQLLVLVGELNKVWRDRERQKLAEVAAAHREELRRLQHTFQQRAPYEAVVAGQKLNDLKRRMRAQAAQAEAAAAAAKAEKRRVEDDSKVMLHAGLSSIQDLSRQVTRLMSRNKKQHKKKRALAEQQPLCSACLDRLLLPTTLAPPPDLLQQQQLQAQNGLDAATAAAAARPFEVDGGTAPAAAEAAATAPAPGTRYAEGPYGYLDAYADAPRYDEYGSHRVGSPSPRLDVPTFNLSARSISGQAAAASEPYNAGAIVRVNMMPPRPPPSSPPPASPSAGRAREDGTVAAAHPRFGGEPVTTVGLHLGPAFVSVTGSGSDAATGVGAQGGGGGAAMELSTASLADWRAGTASAPFTVQIQVAGSSPQRTVVLRSGPPGRDPGTVGGGGGSGGVDQQVVQQARGVPLRVRVRFPRQDLALAARQAQQ
ncbi:hypothetical protein PLESTB_000191200 [Pleodorina starrii]|uniref:Uncharacterized protein n=1 Tax=Pleodorina starrii TaxID=330485 RepID=A0A9W6BBP0_9CHLO|nr:hypothetical protein PLESTB_000191200 [Pleodorina starrii]GLC73562.1 hypothetical protein PLESTF_001391500 [Pleodorina starrii]